jgi:hypothetical protein
MLRPSASAHGAADAVAVASPKAAASLTSASSSAEATLPLPAISAQQPARSSVNPFRAASSARSVVAGVVVSVCAFGALIGAAIAQLVHLRLGGSGTSRWPRRVGPQ